MDKLTKQDQDFVKGVAITGKLTKSAQEAYDIDNPRYATQKAQRLIAKDSINTAIEEVKRTIAEQLPDELLVRVHLEGLNASRTIKSTDDGDIIEPDYAVRHKYLDTAHKIKGSYAPEKSINLNIDAEITNPKARELAQEFEEKLKKTL